MFTYFSKKTGLDISCTFFSIGENLYEILFSGKNKKNIINFLSSAELANRVVKVKELGYANI